MTFSIFHSGIKWLSLGRPRGVDVWPIEEYLVRAKHTSKVTERIRRLNPDGKQEGELPRGVHYTFRWWNLMYDVVGPKEFIEMYGREKYYALPKSAFVRRGHKKAITMQAVAEYT